VADNECRSNNEEEEKCWKISGQRQVPDIRGNKRLGRRRRKIKR